MKSFSTYIAESADKDYTAFLKSMSLVDVVVDRTTFHIDELDDMIYAGKPIDKIMGFFKKFDKPCETMEAFAKADHAGRWKIECQQALKKADKYKEAKKRYFLYAKTFAEVFGAISKGQKQDDAIASLIKLNSKLKCYDLDQGKHTVSFFTKFNEKDILDQIERYKGLVKISGVADLYIQFDNGRVKNFYF
jgi:phosphatidate phosphatase PAH1